MNTIRHNTLAVALALLVGTGTVGQASAASMVAGALEPTQILNNIQLLGSHLQQIASVAKQVQQYKNQANRLRNQTHLMKQLDPGKAGDLLRGVKVGANMADHLTKRFNVAEEMSEVLTSMSSELNTLYREGRIAHHVIEKLQKAGHPISGKSYIAVMDSLAKNKADVYGDRIEQVKKASKTALDDAERLKKIAALNPDISSEIEGLQAIIKTNENLSGLIAYNNQLMTEQTISQMELNQAQILAVDEAHIKLKQKEQYFSPWKKAD